MKRFKDKLGRRGREKTKTMFEKKSGVVAETCRK